ncbi:MAG: ribonuclease R [Pseudomonadota bacterium]|nr:ribonuclease R [Pseudomonadota bacterium]
MNNKRRNASLPTKREVLEFVRDSSEPVGKKEIARAFNIRGPDRTLLNAILRELRNDGELDRGRGRRYGKPGKLPKVGVIEIIDVDHDGEPLARPDNWKRDGNPPKIFLSPSSGHVAAALGDRILARLSPLGDGTYVAHTIKRLDTPPRRVLGIFQIINGKGRIFPISRRIRTQFIVPEGQDNRAAKGDLVEAQPIGAGGLGLPEARVTKVLGGAEGPPAASMIAIHAHDIPVDFDPEAIAAAEAAEEISPNGRKDLRNIPLITIDGADARDFDDAVWAEKDNDGWHLIVAIADVSWYVRAGGPLDRDAFNRGNSVYFPNRVVPMLPEVLSNGLCSLVPKKDRACLAVHIWINSDGQLKRHEFVRGIMRSAARLTYEQVEAAWTGSPDDNTTPFLENVITPLYGAFRALKCARLRRGTIDLELPERKVFIDRRGNISKIQPAERLDSHRLIEEFMIAANVAAAVALEEENAPCMYRVHDRPSMEKVEGLRKTLAPLGIKMPSGHVTKPRHIQRIISQARGKPEMEIVNMAVLRSQSQAQYSPHNVGHFGLAIRKYAHFTSPIRRYSDLLVHRSLIAALGFGDDGLATEDGERFTELGKHISFTERRAIDAEREAVDRLTTLYLADHVGAEFAARVNGVHRAGLFVTLIDTGADGLVPMSMIGDDRFDFDSASQRIKGRRSGKVYGIGDPITVRLENANIYTGSITFSVISVGAMETGNRSHWSKRENYRSRGKKAKPSKPNKPRRK